jgi:hypothetical protein
MEKESNNIQMAVQPQAEVMCISNAESLEALNRSEIDVQIATAKTYRRDIKKSIHNIRFLATMDEETASECFYILPRDGKNIEGPSVRFAEMVASSWGNIRVQARIISNDGRFITAQGICHDLESNYAASSEVKRRITGKNGRTFSDDMQVVTGNAACAIAMRNAIFKVVPYALLKSVIADAKKASIGDSLKIESTRAKMIAYYQKLQVSEQQILDHLHISKVEDIDADMIVELRGIANALKEGTTTIQEAFPVKKEEKPDDPNSPISFIKASMQKQQEQTQETPAVDAETGELFTDNK